MNKETVESAGIVRLLLVAVLCILVPSVTHAVEFYYESEFVPQAGYSCCGQCSSDPIEWCDEITWTSFYCSNCLRAEWQTDCNCWLPEDSCTAATGWDCAPGEKSVCDNGGVSTCAQIGCGSAWQECNDPEPDDEECEENVGNPIDLVTGETHYSPFAPDAEVVTPAGGLSLGRQYSSTLAARHTGFEDAIGKDQFGQHRVTRRALTGTRSWGGGWFHQYERVLVEAFDDNADMYVIHQRPDGGQEVFGPDGRNVEAPARSVRPLVGIEGYELETRAGALIRFELDPSFQGGGGRVFRLFEMVESTGRVINLHYYGKTSLPVVCRTQSWIGPRGGLCLIAASDGSYIHFSKYRNETAGEVPVLRLTELRWGVDHSTLGSGVEPSTRTIYTYTAVEREPGDDKLPILRHAVRQKHSEGQWSDIAVERYSYVDTSYHRSDLSAPHPYATPQPLLGADGRRLWLLRDAKIGRSRADSLTLVSAHEYDSLGRGAASLRAGEYLRIDYDDATERRVVTNESTGATIEYIVQNGRLSAVEALGGCGIDPVAFFERDSSARNRTKAKVYVDPDLTDTIPGSRTTFTYDEAGRVVLEVDNCQQADPQTELDPQSIRNDIAACNSSPNRVRRFEYEPGVIATRRVQSKVFSAICDHPDGSFSSFCSEFDPKIVRTFQGSAIATETSHGMTMRHSDPSQAIEVTRVMSYGRDGEGRLLTTTDPANYVTERVYYGSEAEDDPCGMPTSNNLGQLRLTKRYPAGQPQLAVILSRHGGYDESGLVGCSVDENGTVTRYGYNSLRQLTTLTVYGDGQRRTTSIGYDVSGEIVSTTNGDATRETVLGSDDGECDGPFSLNCLDALGRLGKPIQSKTLVAYGSSHATEVANQVAQYNRSGDPLLLTQFSERGEIRQAGFGYEALTGLQTEQYKFTISEAELLDLAGSAEYTKRITFDRLKRVVTIQDEQFNLPNKEIVHDVLGRVSAVAVAPNGSPDRARTCFYYDPHDNLTAVAQLGIADSCPTYSELQPEHRTTKYLHDDFGQLVLVSSPDSGETRYFYDVVGNLEFKVEAYETAEETWTHFTYDERDRIHQVTFEWNETSSPPPDRIYSYDSPVQAASTEDCGGFGVSFSQTNLGGRLSMVDNESTVTYYSYTPFGEVNAVYELTGQPDDFALCALRITRYEFDDSGRPTAITYPSRRKVTYVYAPGAMGPSRVELVGDSESTPVVLADNIEYGIGGEVAAYDGAGVVFAAGWDLAGQANYRRYQGAPGHWFNWSIDERDGGGNIEIVGDRATGKSMTLSYDDQERLVTVQSQNLRGYQNCGYEYDNSGNRLSEACFPAHTGKTTLYDHEPNTSRLSSLSWDAGGACGRSIPMDEQGRAEAAFTKRFASSTDRLGLQYGPSGRLASVDIDRDDLADVSFAYDHRGLRVETATTTAIRSFTFDPFGQLLAEASGDGASFVEYVWLGDIPLAMLVDSDGMTGSTQAAVFPLGVDHLGTPHRAWTDEGQFAWAADYEAFGKAWEYLPNSPDGPSVAVNLRLPGQYLDRQTGLHYNWHRYYDPNTGRYLTPDPLLSGARLFIDQRSVHVGPGMMSAMSFEKLRPYSYVGGNPIGFSDPLGLARCASGSCADCPSGIWSGGGFSYEIGAGIGYAKACGTVSCWGASSEVFICQTCLRFLAGGAIAASGAGLFCANAECKETLTGTSGGLVGAFGTGIMGAGGAAAAGKSADPNPGPFATGSVCGITSAGLGAGYYVGGEICWTE